MKPKLSVFLMLAFLQYAAIAQDNVGIGVANPNPNAIMELFANNKGLLIPRLTDAERIAIPAGLAETGLLVYGKTDNLFYYWDASQWIPFPATQASAYNLALQYDTINKILSITDGGGTLSTAIPSGSDDDWSRAAGVLFPFHLADQVAIGGNSADPSAILDVQSTTQGALLPKMTTAQRQAIASPAIGLLVYDTTVRLLMQYNGTRWREVGADPIGTIQAYHKSFAGTPILPYGWAECNGQVLNDTESPYDGSTMPDLNGTFTTEAGGTSTSGRFLRGGATSGTLSTDQTNTVLDFDYESNNNGCCGTFPVPIDGSYSQLMRYEGNPDQNHGMRMRNRGVETHPGNMTVVWIIRVK